MIYANFYAEGRDNNSLFAQKDTIHRFNPTATPRLLREAFLNKGVEINTPDLNKGNKICFDLYLEGQRIIDSDNPRFLIALENPNINKLNADFAYCQKFTKVFTWDVRLHKLKNFLPILIPYPFLLPATIKNFTSFKDRKIFSCLINANKAFKENLPTDLYLERIKTIKWYENYAPNKFELYGMGWDKNAPAFNWLDKIKRIIPRIKTKFFDVKPYPSYQGEVSDKLDILLNSKFSYCYENSRDIKNYVTEKIFDCLIVGCVPIYWGSDNVAELIPANCFIDRRNFVNTADVHRYLLTVTDSQYEQYQKNIYNFLHNDLAKNFEAKNIVSKIVENVMTYV